jgi:hypothetical protein
MAVQIMIQKVRFVQQYDSGKSWHIYPSVLAVGGGGCIHDEVGVGGSGLDSSDSAETICIHVWAR